MDLISDEQRLKASAHAVANMMWALTMTRVAGLDETALTRALYTAYQGQDGWWYGHLYCGQGHYMISERAGSHAEAIGNAQDTAHVLIRTYS